MIALQLNLGILAFVSFILILLEEPVGVPCFLVSVSLLSLTFSLSL
jgi:hypothetical protein